MGWGLEGGEGRWGMLGGCEGGGGGVREGGGDIGKGGEVF